MCMVFHTSVRHLSEKFLANLGRHNYVTPTSYLELICTYLPLLLGEAHAGEHAAQRATSRSREAFLRGGAGGDDESGAQELRPVLGEDAVETEEKIHVVAKDRRSRPRRCARWWRRTKRSRRSARRRRRPSKKTARRTSQGHPHARRRRCRAGHADQGGHHRGEGDEEAARRRQAGDGGGVHPEGREAGEGEGPRRRAAQGGGLLGSPRRSCWATRSSSRPLREYDKDNINEVIKKIRKTWRCPTSSRR